eukprot:TRINITY_DN83292_c0_g1_i1.p1 TRINITY_DN83292_c0_g1~~TRINITY_DN83292_c0_g1_i1.p1  ORF type:complete len:273 (+),score=23.91 TRINITY_DN83292_c0_g1_i1:41-859(+)
MPTTVVVHEWSFTRVELGGENLQVLGAWLVAREDEDSCDGTKRKTLAIDVASEIRLRCMQDQSVVLRGIMFTGFADPAPLQRKRLTVVYDGHNEYHVVNQSFQMLRGAVAGCVLSTMVNVAMNHAPLTSAGPSTATLAAALAGCRDPLELVTTATATVLTGAWHWNTCREGQHSSQCGICLEEVCDRFDKVTKHDRGVPSSVPCGHCFHSSCISPWNSLGRGCPICRATPQQELDCENFVPPFCQAVTSCRDWLWRKWSTENFKSHIHHEGL